MNITSSCENVIEGYYHGLFYYLIVSDPFAFSYKNIKPYVIKYDRGIKLTAALPSISVNKFNLYLAEKYPNIPYFVNKQNYVVRIYTNENIDCRQIFTDTGFYCKTVCPPVSQVGAKLEKLYQKNFTRLYKLKQTLYKGRSNLEYSDYLLFTVIGGGYEIGRSCYLLTTKNTKILLDIGMGFKKGKQIPQLESYFCNFDSITGVIVTHPHLDHVGNIITLIKKGYTGPIFMTRSCLKLTYLSLLDSIKILNKQGLANEFSELDVQKLFQQVIIINYEQKLVFSENMSIVVKNSCHVLGGCMLQIYVNNRLYLFTSDFNTSSPGVELLKPLKLKSSYDRIISEGTNLNKVSDYSLLLTRLKQSIQTVKQNSGTLLMPCLLYGRGQEIIYNLSKLFSLYPQLKLPIYVTKSINHIHNIYWEHMSELSSIGKEFMNSGYIENETLTISSSLQPEILEKSSIIIAPSGMLQGGPAIHWLLKIIQDPASVCLLSCYQAPGTLGHSLQHSGEETIKIQYENVIYSKFVKCKIDSISPFFGAHITRDKLLTVLKSSKASPLIIHTDYNNTKQIIKAEKYSTPKNLETVRLI